MRHLCLKSLDILRFPLAVIILINHVFNDGLLTQGFTSATDNYSLFYSINKFLDAFFRGYSVPIYFFISGFLFFLSTDLTEKIYIQKLKNRIRTLLIPFLIWNTIAIILLIVRLIPCFSILLANENNAWNPSLSGFLSCFNNYNSELTPVPSALAVIATNGKDAYPINYPLWFLRDLMIVVLSIPFLYPIIKKAQHYFIIILGLVWLALSFYQLGRINQLATAYIFFSWGAYLSINKKDILHEFGKFFKFSIILYPLLAVLFIVSTNYYPALSALIKKLNILVGLFAAFNICAWILQNKNFKVSNFLASSSVFIFVAHALICDRITKILYAIILPTSELSVVIVYSLSIIISLCLLLSIFYFLRNYVPSVLRICIGKK